MMPTQFFLLPGIFFQRPKASQAQAEARFAIAEKRRNQEFSASMLEYGRRFTDEEKAQWEGEKHRNPTFDRLIAGLDGASDVAAKERDKAFQEEEARRRDIFHGSEDLREKRFSQAEANRTVGVSKLQELHKERAEWYARIRESRFQHGRQERDEMCQKLGKDMLEQLERLLRWEEECFTSAEQQRDKIVQEIVNNGKFPHKTQDNDVRRLPIQAAANDPQRHSPVDSDHQYDSNGMLSHSRRSRSPSRSPVRDSPPLPPPRSHRITPFSPAVSARTNDRLPVLASRPEDDQSVSYASSPSGRPSSSSGSGIQRAPLRVIPEPTSSVTIDALESRFKFNEAQRHAEFMQEEGQRHIRFLEAESGREEAERARTTALEQRETMQDQAFRDMKFMHRDIFKASEASRSWREEWRTQESETAEEHRTESFRQALALIEKQFYALNDLEADAVQCSKNKLERVDRMHRELFLRARQQRSAAFSLSQARRELELLIPSWKLDNKGDTIQVPERIIISRYPRRSRIGSWSRNRSRRSHAWSARYSASSVGSMSKASPPLTSRPAQTPSFPPPTGFHPRALFNGADLSQPLPIPRLYKYKDGSDDHRLRHLAFTKSQAERDKLFENGMQSRRRLFDANERQRELRFDQLQTNTTKASVQRERERFVKFVDAQKARQMAFRDAERQRESNFRNAETQRAERHKTAQIGRDASFYSTQEMLQRQCFQSDHLRTSEFEKWASDLLREEGERQTDIYKTEEREREARFARAIALCAEQRAAGAHSTLLERGLKD